MKTFLFPTLILTLFITSCAGTRGMRVEVMRPAEVTVNKEIQSVAILNRGIPNETSKTEGLLTLEKKNQDKQLTQECIRGLNDLLQTSFRFTVKQCDSSYISPSLNSTEFGDLLDWATVDSICAKYEVQALLVLEYFDTDFSVFNPAASAQSTINNVLNGNGTSVQIKGTAKAVSGWRVYDPKNKSIVFQERFSWTKTWTQTSTNPVEALGRLIKPNEALSDVSYYCGNEFAASIVPLFFWEDREMYKGKKNEMERAERMALSKDWEGALKLWQDVYEESPKKKIRARAAFNAALACEVLGDLPAAQKWVQKSYVEDGNDPALDYSDILDKRIREQGKISEQLGE